MDELTFRGVIAAGIGKYSELTIPGCRELPNAPEDWPEALHPGSLNVKIRQDGFPELLLIRCSGDRIQRLDSKIFEPEFVIPGSQIKQNRLKPTLELPCRGDAQIWPAIVRKACNGDGFRCWLVRRLGSGLRDQLELVSDRHLRSAYSLIDGTAVEVTILGCWSNG